MRYEVRTMSLAEILDTAFRLLRNHFVLICGISAVLYVPVSVFQAGMESWIEAGDPVGIIGGGLVGGLLLFAASTIVGVSITFAVAEVYLGRDVSIGRALRKGLEILVPVLGTSLLSALAVFGAMLLLIVPGIYVALGLVVLSQVMVLESRFGTRALRRSFALMAGHRLRAFGVLLVASVLTMVLGFAVQLALGYVPLVGPVGQGLVNSVTGGYSAAVLMLLYFDIRCRKEAFELEQLAQLVAAGAGPARA
jgi:hypothetical protein